MKRILLFALVSGMFPIVGGAQVAEPAAAGTQVPDMILHNGKIVTVNDASFTTSVGTIAQAMALRNGYIVAVGTNDSVLRLAGPRTRKIDLKGRTVLPGLVDTHDHLHDWVLYPHSALLPGAITDQDIVVREVKGSSVREVADNFLPTLRRALDVAKPGQWLDISLSRGERDEFRQALQELAGPGGEITKEVLDRWATRHPVLVHVSGGLKILLNQVALDAVRKAYPPGTDTDYQPAEQLFKEGIGGVTDNRAIVPDVMFKDRVDLLGELYRREMEWWAGYGITTWQTNLVASNPLNAYIHLDRNGLMPIRLAWAYRLNTDNYTPYQMSALAATMGKGSPYFWLNGVIAGSSFTCTTLPIRASGASFESRENCAFQPGGSGFQAVKDLVKAGLPIRNLHAGPLPDKDIDFLFQAIAEAAKEAKLSDEQVRSQRHAVDHCHGVPRPDQIPLYKKFGIIASCNPLSIYDSLPNDVARYGERYAKWFVPRKSLIDAGVVTTSEIDRPIGPTIFTPFFYMHLNMTRKGNDGKVYAPEERIDRVSALKMNTIWGAYNVFREKQLGSLEAEKWADFIILDRDFLTIPEDDIPKIRVLATAVGGKFVHVRSEIASDLGETPKGTQALAQ